MGMYWAIGIAVYLLCGLTMLLCRMYWDEEYGDVGQACLALVVGLLLWPLVILEDGVRWLSDRQFSKWLHPGYWVLRLQSYMHSKWRLDKEKELALQIRIMERRGILKACCAVVVWVGMFTGTLYVLWWIGYWQGRR